MEQYKCSPSQKKALKIYYEKNKEKINESKRKRYAELKQQDEYKNKCNERARLNYLKRKQKKKNE